MNEVTSKIKYQPEEDARCKNANDTNYSIFIFFSQKMQYFCRHRSDNCTKSTGHSLPTYRGGSKLNLVNLRYLDNGIKFYDQLHKINFQLINH